MSVVNVSEVSPSLFIVGIVFLLLIFGLLSFGILRMFQQRYRAGWISFGGAAASFGLLLYILNRFYD